MQHLDEMALEALASGREDLLSDDARAHVEACEECKEIALREGEWAREAAVALKRSAVKVEGLDAMIARAMSAAPLAPAASRRSLWIGAAAGGVSAAVLAALSLRGAPSITALSAVGRQGVTLVRAADRLVESLVPGGWIAVAVVGLVVAMMLALPIQALLGNKRLNGSGLATSAIALFLAIATLAPALSARAYRVEGEWPEGRTVTLDVEQRPTSEALRLAAESAGLGGVVARLPDDPPVTMHVRDVPLADVVQALIGDANVVVIVTPTLLTLRPDAAADAVPVADTAVVVAESEPAADPGADADPDAHSEIAPTEIPDGLGDRVTLGSDTHVREGETVRGVYTMGGDARIDGRAFGDVVTMGGDADVRGEVVGNLTTMGGDIRVREGALVTGDLNAMGGEIDVDEGARVTGQMLSSAEGGPTIHLKHHTDDDAEDTLGNFFRWALWHALLFLLGLVLLGTARQRIEVLRTELTERPLRNMFGGSFAMIAGLIITGVLVLTVIGIPGSAILGTALFIGACIGWVTAALCLGSVLPIAALKDRPVAQLAVGLGVLFAVGLIPIIGTLIVVLVALAGFGAVAATNIGKMPRGGRHHVPTGPFRDSAL